MCSKAEIEQIIANLNYDFHHFKLTPFIHHLEIHLNTRIYLMTARMDRGTFGLWRPTQIGNFLYYSERLHLTHKIHTLLHELGHLILGHRAKPLPPGFSDGLGLDEDEGAPEGLLRVASLDDHDDPQEKECEMFVYLIQHRLAQAQRLEAITTGSSIEPLKRYADAMGYTE